MEDIAVDCVVIGGGPAGLTAAIYLARFHLRVTVVDAGRSRAAMIPRTRNHAGYPEGIAGKELVARMRAQAELNGAEVLAGEVIDLRREDGGFLATTAHRRLAARTVLLATGVVNHRPGGMDDDLHDEALARGLLRYCPICDGFEVSDRRIGVIGTGERGIKEALFLRSYTRDVALIAPEGMHALDTDATARLDRAGVSLIDGPAGAFALDDAGIGLVAGGERLRFASIYPALGSDISSELAVRAGAEASAEGCLLVDAHQRTSIAGLYAAGDVVQGLDQISHAMGEGGVAATTIRNDLAERAPLYR